MREVKLEEGRYIRIKGDVTIYSPSGKNRSGWYGGSTWTVKNPLIRLGKFDHRKFHPITWFKGILGKRIYCKGRIICSDCGHILKLEK